MQGRYAADFLTIYVSEAHSADEWQLPHALGAGDAIPVFDQPKALGERVALARCFAERFPDVGRLVVDTMSNEAAENYAAWPERLYIIVDGAVVYKGGPGPFGYVLKDVKDWLDAHASVT